ncbi:MAG: alpha-glucosidase [Actinomycetota bacterium]
MHSVGNDWWRDAVIYQIYPRSFADASGDGIGDIAGIRSRIPHLVELGIDAIWVNPWYRSPMFDAGYDVVTYEEIDPLFGTVEEAEQLIAELHAVGIRTIVDVVPNHTSHLHTWFQEALAAGPGSPERERYIFRDGRGPNGDLPPNDWVSCFHGPAWTRVTEADGTPGQWYLHLFAPEQPDRNWEHPDTVRELEDALRFWFDKGVDGFRIDVAHSLFKAPGLPDLNGLTWDDKCGEHPHWDQPGIHEIYRSWRRIADSYDPPRVFVAEAWVPDHQRLKNYVRPDELHTSFNFDFLTCPWDAARMRRVIDVSLETLGSVGAPATWVLGNHDVARVVSRYARKEQRRGQNLVHLAKEYDLEMGQRRARAAIMLMLALPGSVYLYQGEELGLPEVEDLPGEVMQDPTWARSGGTDPGRDGCRVPLPWSPEGPTFGFNTTGVEGWLPQPEWFGRYAAASQEGAAGSMLGLYRTMLAARRAEPALGGGEIEWLESPSGVLAFVRDGALACVVNMTGIEPCAVPAGEVVQCSGTLTSDGRLPIDTAVWIRL